MTLSKPLRIFSDPRTAGYGEPGHPEAPRRVSRSAAHLAASGWTIEAPSVRAMEGDVLAVHTPAHWRAVREGLYSDPDTPPYPSIADIALVSLSGALSAARSALEGTPAFSLMRPPGHHAGPERIAGFCFVNNVAAAGASLSAPGRRIAFLDVDVHHGDGTEAIARSRIDWRYISLHQAPLYPGTGLESEGNAFNHPLPWGTGPERYLKELDEAIREAMDFHPSVLAISAGFDTYQECPIAGMKLDEPCYEEIGRRLAATGLPRFAVLEGGYADALPRLIERFLTGFAG